MEPTDLNVLDYADDVTYHELSISILRRFDFAADSPLAKLLFSLAAFPRYAILIDSRLDEYLTALDTKNVTTVNIFRDVLIDMTIAIRARIESSSIYSYSEFESALIKSIDEFKKTEWMNDDILERINAECLKDPIRVTLYLMHGALTRLLNEMDIAISSSTDE